MIFTKSTHWKHEEEFRFVGFNENKDDENSGVIIECVPAIDIYLGKKGDRAILKTIKNSIINSDTFKRIEVDDFDYKLRI